VVCAGATVTLDLRLTLGSLETAGVPVLGYQVDGFPTFSVRGSLPHTGSVLITAPIQKGTRSTEPRSMRSSPRPWPGPMPTTLPDRRLPRTTAEMTTLGVPELTRVIG
jgi:Indigoidine synthase A like protein